MHSYQPGDSGESEVISIIRSDSMTWTEGVNNYFFEKLVGRICALGCSYQWAGGERLHGS